MNAPVPSWMIWLLRGFCHADYLDEVQGDLEEMYELRLQRMPVWKARWLFLLEVVLSFKTYVITGDKNSYPSNNQHIMFRNYLTLAIRNLQKNKLFSTINILGLGIGLACSVLIFMYVANELSYDTYHKHAERTYRVTELMTSPEGDITENSASVPWSVGPTLKSDFPELTVTRLYQAWQKDPLVSDTSRQKAFYEEDMFFVDSSFFRTFSFNLIAGNKEKALSRPQSVVLTESAAKRYFGATDVLGKTLIMEDTLELTVTAVTEDVPANSHFHYDLLVPLLNIGDIFNATGNPWNWEGWYWNPVHTYVVLPEHFSKSTLANHFPGFVKDHFPGPVVDHTTLGLQRLTDIHFDTEKYQQMEAGVNQRNIYMAAAIALFILVIAAINFVNLTTATATRRAREVGIRKVMGSSRYSLMMQFYGEAIAYCLLSLMLAVLLIYLMIPAFEQLVNTTLNLDYLVTWQSVLLVLAGVLLLGLLAGTYPALIISGFSPTQVLKAANLAVGTNVSLLRQGLVTFQFVVSILLIFSSAVIYLQHEYLTSQELGFEEEEVIMFSIRGTEIMSKRKVFKNQLTNRNEVISATALSDIVGQDVPVRPFGINGYNRPQNVAGLYTDYDFLETFGVELIAGRDFNKKSEEDRGKLLMNKAMLDQLKDKDWKGQQIKRGRWESEIIGMVENFHFKNLRQQIRPLLIGFQEGSIGYMAVRVREGNVYETVGALEDVWKAFEPERPFRPFFLDDKLNSMYQSEQRTAELISYFSVLAIFIAFLGLVGLVTYRVNTRVKEIGIRKVLGASETRIFGLLSREFMGIILLANAIALPLGWYVMHDWLENFAYRVTIPWWLFVVSGAAVLLVAGITSFTRSWSAIRRNPVYALKEE